MFVHVPGINHPTFKNIYNFTSRIEVNLRGHDIKLKNYN